MNTLQINITSRRTEKVNDVNYAGRLGRISEGGKNIKTITFNNKLF